MDEVTILSTTNLKDDLLRRVADVSPRVSVRRYLSGRELLNRVDIGREY